MSKRARTERREREREAAKLARSRMKLAELEPGGAPSRPLDVESASVIEVQATSAPCVACGASSPRVLSHEAKTLEGRSLRVVRIGCARCGTPRDLYFRIAPPLTN